MIVHAIDDLLIGGMTVVVTLIPVPIPLGDNSVATAIMVMTRLTGHRVKRANVKMLLTSGRVSTVGSIKLELQTIKCYY